MMFVLYFLNLNVWMFPSYLPADDLFKDRENNEYRSFSVSFDFLWF